MNKYTAALLLILVLVIVSVTMFITGQEPDKASWNTPNVALSTLTSSPTRAGWWMTISTPTPVPTSTQTATTTPTTQKEK